jgi:hypothetical protein
MEFFNDRYAALATQLTSLVEALDAAANPDDVIDPYRLANIWTAHNDARGYAIIGDPAVRLMVAQP